MKKVMNLAGWWNGWAADLGDFEVQLPGTLDTNGIGHPDVENLAGRLTRVHTYEGVVTYSKKILLPACERGRLILKAERTRNLSIKIEGNDVPVMEPGTLSTPFLFDVTAYQNKEVSLQLLVDNSYHDWPRDSIIGSSAATDETQTNWNGILGEFCIYQMSDVDISNVRFYPSEKACTIFVEIIGVTKEEWTKGQKQILIESECLKQNQSVTWRIANEPVFLFDGEANERLILVTDGLLLDSRIRCWDEGEGNLYKLTVSVYEKDCKNENSVDSICAERSQMVGIRTFGVNDSMRLTLNHRPFFLRGEANCCVFPEEGHPPVTEKEWKNVLSTYAAYGVNCMRFHSWCPPEAAFVAADEMGMMMQPELSQWNFKNAFAEKKDRDYYHKELYEILKWYGSHPSFVMLTFGNELQYTEEGYQDAQKLLTIAKQYDPTRLYAHSSNYHYGETGVDQESDFYTAMAYYDDILRATSSPMIGHLNESYPSSDHCYDEAVAKVQKHSKPVFEFEVGQYEILPEFSEIEEFHGVTRARNYEIVKEHVDEAGMSEYWAKDVEATGELALLCYREEVEASLRTRQMCGLSLLGLQDFPGQGTALVGMLNSHLRPKPYSFASPERFRAFFRPELPLLYLPRYCFRGGETLSARLEIANYGKCDMQTMITCKLLDNGKCIWMHVIEKRRYHAGETSYADVIEIKIPDIKEAKQMEILIEANTTRNSYPIWIFPMATIPEEQNFKIATRYTEELRREIEDGAVVYLEPPVDEEHLPNSIGGQFSTDFWSVGTFPVQNGGMGLVIEENHPALSKFPTEFYSQYQWWPMANGRPMILPQRIKPIVRVPDSYSRLKHMGLLFETRIGKGVLMVSSMGLLYQDYPECKGLLNSLFSYLNTIDSTTYPRSCVMTGKELDELFIGKETEGENDGQKD